MGACIGVMLFGDHLTFALGLGGLMIIAGSFIVVLGEKRAPPVCASAGPI
jgi:drug/metabolite transporter (DMT)-like permease